jgi:3-polyprenyl-4-hydroxybenzoate decarboxylase
LLRESGPLALEAAGLEIIHRVIVYSDKELIKILKKFNRQNGRLPLSKDMKRINGYPSIEVYMNRFGSWNKALLAAGLDLNNAIYSDKELIKLLRKAAKVLRKPYIATHLKKLKNYPSPKTFRKRFGNWDKALKAAGLKN